MNRQGNILLRSVANQGVYGGDNIFDNTDSNGGNQESLNSFMTALEQRETLEYISSNAERVFGVSKLEWFRVKVYGVSIQDATITEVLNRKK